MVKLLQLALLLQTFALASCTTQHVEVSMVVKAAKDLKANALYCVARYADLADGLAVAWDDMPKSSTRESNRDGAEFFVKAFNLAYRIGAVDGGETGVIVKLYNSQNIVVGTASGKIDASKIGSAGSKQTWKVNTGGTIDIDFSNGNTLAAQGLTESMNFGPANPIAPQRSVKVEDVTGLGPMVVGTAPLPERLQGLWWLTEQGASSAMLTFGGPNDDGAGCNTGFLVGPNNEAKIRVQGERSFSSAQPTWADQALEAFDAVYKFTFDDALNPSHGQIFSESVNGFPWTGPKTTFLSNFEMKYLVDGDPLYPNSKVWLRTTSFGGVNANHDYKLVQVMDGKGNRIEPTWTKFAAYMDSDATGWTPGWMFYKSKRPSPSVGAPAMTAMVTSVIRRRLILAIVLGVLACLCCCGCCLAGAKHVIDKRKSTSSREYEDVSEEEDEE